MLQSRGSLCTLKKRACFGTLLDMAWVGKVVKLEVKGELMMMATGKAADKNAGAGRCV